MLQTNHFTKHSIHKLTLVSVRFYFMGCMRSGRPKQIVLAPPNLMDISISLLIWWSEMISPSEDRQAERKKQAEHARAISATRKRNREEELRHLHLLATEVGVLLGGKTRSSAMADAWMFVDLGENHELSFYHQGDLINIRGRVDGLSYTLNVSPHLPPADIVKVINRKSASLQLPSIRL